MHVFVLAEVWRQNKAVKPPGQTFQAQCGMASTPQFAIE
ncbi:hypothetical protein [Devosia sp. DBB001]|nr:hypothetical protein [Devosia sp. DBB001]